MFIENILVTGQSGTKNVNLFIYFFKIYLFIITPDGSQTYTKQ